MVIVSLACFFPYLKPDSSNVRVPEAARFDPILTGIVETDARYLEEELVFQQDRASFSV